MNRIKKYDDVISNLICILKRYTFFQDIRQVLLFGSMAKNQETGASDIDIMILFDNTIELSNNRFELRRMISDGMSHEFFDVDIDIHYEYYEKFIESSSIFYREIKKCEVCLYDRK